MEIENTPLYREAMDIMVYGNAEPMVGWSAMIHLGNEENETYTPMQVTAVNVTRDYIHGYADEITCTFLIPLGKYVRRVYPNRKHLQVTLYKAPLSIKTGRMNYDEMIETERYSATLIDSDDAGAEGQGKETNDEETLDLHGFLDVHFQLYSKSVEQIRMTSVGGVYRKTNVQDLLLSVLTDACSRIEVDDKLAIEGVDLTPVSNEEIQEQIIVTHGIRLFDLPNYLQKTIGVYNSGLGSYIQNRNWYIFPMYDTTQFEKTERTLTVFILPTSKLPEIEKSFRTIGDSVMLLVSGKTGFKDDSGTSHLKYGNGATLSNANSFLDDYNTTKGNKTVVARARNNSEFITEKRDDNLNNSPMVNDRITANPFTVYSSLNKTNGGVFHVHWNNSDPGLLTPGMLTKIIYFDEGETKEIFGTLLGAEHISLKIGDVNTVRHSTNSALHFFVNRNT